MLNCLNTKTSIEYLINDDTNLTQLGPKFLDFWRSRNLKKTILDCDRITSQCLAYCVLKVLQLTPTLK